MRSAANSSSVCLSTEAAHSSRMSQRHSLRLFPCGWASSPTSLSRVLISWNCHLALYLCCVWKFLTTSLRGGQRAFMGLSAAAYRRAGDGPAGLSCLWRRHRFLPHASALIVGAPGRHLCWPCCALMIPFCQLESSVSIMPRTDQDAPVQSWVLSAPGSLSAGVHSRDCSSQARNSSLHSRLDFPSFHVTRPTVQNWSLAQAVCLQKHAAAPSGQLSDASYFCPHFPHQRLAPFSSLPQPIRSLPHHQESLKAAHWY